MTVRNIPVADSLPLRRKEVAFSLLLIVAYLASAFFWQDISFYDESLYLESARSVHVSTFLNEVALNPLYSSWFKFLTIFCANPVWRYFLSWALLVALVASIPIMMRIDGAWLYVLLILSGPVVTKSLFAVAPYVSLFAAVFFVAGLCCVRRLQLDLRGAVFLSLVSCFVVAFCRPEYGYGMFFSTTAFLGVAMLPHFRRATGGRVILCSLAAVLSLAMIVVLLNSPSNRSGVAFAQHVNLRASRNHLLGASSPWTSDYALKTFNVDVHSNAANTTAKITDFARANPALFIQHIYSNLVDPNLVILLFMYLFMVIWPWYSDNARGMRSMSAYLFLTSLPVLIVDALIYPRAHYAVIILPSFLLYLIMLIGVGKYKPSTYFLAMLFCLAVPLIALSTIGLHSIVKNREFRLPHPGIQTVRCLQEVDAASPAPRTAMFDPLGFPNVYLRSPRTQVPIFDFSSWDAFRSWVVSTKPTWIVVSPAVHLTYGVSDAEIGQYLEHSVEYVPHVCPAETQVTVYVSPHR